ncbi:TrkA N-terminal domain protein [Mageeibacillus indolicus UPII9-5]|uniref:TrkA N-terminal domain protein n=1 Tax=Mageeibacillus indolicus (strain UPII9-5) TaxID=699246 RepID=D3QZV3_MAGIU|nr:TrkA family potassium uptake protein [Mageeibacillus indolicus]ADC91138.1 TrkA N-terminal domain protein [Mageeibacillus indolicus UPII9-5]
MKRNKLYGVLGLGVFGSTIAQTLAEKGYEVIAVDKEVACVDRLAESVAQANIADITDIEQLREIGIGNCDIVVVAVSSQLEVSLMAILNLQELGIPYILAKAKNKKAVQILTRIGVNKVVRPEHDMGERVAKSLMSQNIIDVIDLDENYSIVEMHLPNSWVGHSIIDLDVRNKYGINILGIREPDDTALTINFDIHKPLAADITLYVIAPTAKLNKFNF